MHIRVRKNLFPLHELLSLSKVLLMPLVWPIKVDFLISDELISMHELLSHHSHLEKNIKMTDFIPIRWSGGIHTYAIYDDE